jgi:multidrug efflux pump
VGSLFAGGLAAKDAYLIVECAREGYEHGASLVDAALTGARVRLRPILHDRLRLHPRRAPARVLDGAGANSRQILGATVMWGMLAATFIAIFIIPVTFYVSEHFRRAPEKARLPKETVSAPISGGTDSAGHSVDGPHP